MCARESRWVNNGQVPLKDAEDIDRGASLCVHEFFPE